MKYKSWLLFVFSLLFGFLLVTQYQSYLRASEELGRSSSLNYVSQLKLLLQGNEQLSNELNNVQTQLDNTPSSAANTELQQKEIQKYRLLDGSRPVSGKGIQLKLALDLEEIWFTDLINELYLAGAQAVSLNGERLVGTEGLMSEEHDGRVQLKIGQKLLSQPYLVAAIGDPDTLYAYLTEYDSTLKRIQSNFGASGKELSLSKADRIEMAAISK